MNSFKKFFVDFINAGNGNETVFGNPDITWETVHMLDVGADIRLFKNLTVTFDYYNKLTTDMIITPPISYIGGISAAPLNSGKVRNKGWEFDVSYNKQVHQKDLLSCFHYLSNQHVYSIRNL